MTTAAVYPVHPVLGVRRMRAEQNLAGAAAALAQRLRGPLHLPGDAGYDQECAGYNLAVHRRPALVVGATGVADVVAAVGFATDHGLPVGVLGTGHGAAPPADGALLVTTRRMQGVRVDPAAGVARLEAGVRWDRVIHEAAAFGLAPLSGSSPTVGAVGYTLGGGIGPLGRAFGYAADHVRSIDVVTAHGTLRTVSAQCYPDLFWALRGGKGNFGVVTSMVIDLFRVSRIFGGGLYFPASAAPAVFTAYRRWVASVPDEMTSSIALTRFPLGPQVPDRLRGRFVVHVRLAYHGPSAAGERLVRPLCTVAVPIRNTLAELPFAAAGTIHDDPVGPVQLHERTTCLRTLDEDLIDVLLGAAGPDSASPLRLVELRHLGAALSRPPAQPNSVGNRDAEFLLYAVDTGTGDDASAGRQHADRLMADLQPWCTGGTALNFMGIEDTAADRVRLAYQPEHYRRLVAAKRAYDPDNLFRVNHNIAPLARTED